MSQGIPETPQSHQFTLEEIGLDDPQLTQQDLISIRRGDQNVLNNAKRAAAEGRALEAYTEAGLAILIARVAEITKRVPELPQS